MYGIDISGPQDGAPLGTTNTVSICFCLLLGIVQAKNDPPSYWERLPSCERRTRQVDALIKEVERLRTRSELHRRALSARARGERRPESEGPREMGQVGCFEEAEE